MRAELKRMLQLEAGRLAHPAFAGTAPARRPDLGWQILSRRLVQRNQPAVRLMPPTSGYRSGRLFHAGSAPLVGGLEACPMVKKEKE